MEAEFHMAFFCLILSFVLSHLVALPLASDESSSLNHPNCPPFECGKLGFIRFPFTHESCPECGLYTVKNCNEPYGKKQKIQLKSGGIWFDVDSISQANVIHINDEELKKRINDRNCSILNDMALPITASSSLSTANNLTLLNCREDPKDAIPLYISSFSCPGYYTNPNYNRFPNCSEISVPIRPVGPDHSFSEFTSDFQLEVTVFDSCYECFFQGGQCLTTPEGNFNCTIEKTKTGKGAGKKNLKIALGVGVPGVILLMLLYALWYCRKRRAAAAPNIIRKNISCQTYSKFELEKATNKYDHDRELGNN